MAASGDSAPIIVACCHCGTRFDERLLAGTFLDRRCPRCGVRLCEDDYDDAAARLLEAARAVADEANGMYPQIKELEELASLLNGGADGLYLRYIPQQWLALAPSRDGRTVFPGSPGFLDLAIDLQEVVDVVGWSPTTSFGSISSMNADCTLGVSYATLALASPAMPTVTGEMVIDGDATTRSTPKRPSPSARA